MPKLRHLAFTTVLFGIVAVLLITWSVGLRDVVDILLRGSLVFLIGYVLVSLLIAVVHAWKWQLILHSQGTHVPYGRLFAYRLMGYSVGYLTPTMHAGSEPVRALLLKQEGIPTSKAFSSVLIDRSVELLSDVTFFFIGALLIVNSVDVAGNMKLVILSISLIAMLLMGMFIAGVLGPRSMFVGIFRFFRLHKVRRFQHAEEHLQAIEKEVEDFYRTKREYFLALVGVVLALWALMYLEYRFALLILGETAGPIQIFLILTGVGLAYSIPIPAAMGTLELGQLSAAKVLNLSSATGIALAFLIRARDITWTVLGLILLSLHRHDFRTLADRSQELDERLGVPEGK